MNGAEKQAQFKARMRAKGLAQATEWIPETKKPLFREIAAALREGKDPQSIVTSNPLPEPEGAALREGKDPQDTVTSNNPDHYDAVKEHYLQTRSKDPKSALERAARAYVEAMLIPKVDAAVASRVLKEREELAEMRQTLYGLQEEAQADMERAKELRMSLPGLMTEEEYRLIRGCLHPDRAPEDRKTTFSKAFDIFSRLAKSVNRIPIRLRRKQGWA